MTEEEKIEFLKELFGDEAVGEATLTLNGNTYFLFNLPDDKQGIIKAILERESQFWANIGEQRMKQKIKNLLSVN